MYCASKNIRSTQCTVYCGTPKDKCWELNKDRKETTQDLEKDNETNSHVAYTRVIFDELCLRYEEPESRNRWDSPLLITYAGEAIPMETVRGYLFEMQKPTPNQSTQSVSIWR